MIWPLVTIWPKSITIWARRYHDASFLKALATLPTRDALALYGEVLLKIQSHYVAEPNWKALVQRGTQGLQVALGVDSFVKQNVGRRLTAAEIQNGIGHIDAMLRARQIRTRQDAQEAVSAAAQLAQQTFGCPSWPPCSNTPAAPRVRSMNTRPT